MPAATSAERSRSASSAVMPQCASCRCSSARVGAELLVANSTRTPTPRRRATASSTPGMGCPASHTTPSRSTTQVPSGGGGHIGPRLTGLPRLGRRGRPGRRGRRAGARTCARSRRPRASTATSACRSAAVTAVRVGRRRRGPSCAASGHRARGCRTSSRSGPAGAASARTSPPSTARGPAVVVELERRRLRAARRHRRRRGGRGPRPLRRRSELTAAGAAGRLPVRLGPGRSGARLGSVSCRPRAAGS